jgi:hypothetical protein
LRSRLFPGIGILRYESRFMVRPTLFRDDQYPSASRGHSLSLDFV